MKRIHTIATGLLASAAIWSAGCSGMSNTARGAGLGAGLGAGAGALLGHASGGKAGKGALIGAGVGTLAGALVGNEADQEERRDLENRVIHAEARESVVNQELAATQSVSELTVDQVVSMSRTGVQEEVIINQIKTTGSTFHVTANDIEWLKSNGVSDRVILEMQNTRQRPHVVAPPRQVIHRSTQPVIIEHERPVIIHRHTRPIYVAPRRGVHVGVGFHDHCW